MILVINMVNFIKMRSLNSRIFEIICNEKSDFENLLCHILVGAFTGKVVKGLSDLEINHF